MGENRIVRPPVVWTALLAAALASWPGGSGAARAEAKPNHLLGQTSPYLQEHLNNPVDWYPWGDEATRRARDEGKPIFLSIGYSACHWCHVMEREAFSDDGIARLLNEHFVAVKVDREERPDLDAIYMSAVQAMTGSGGWPMSVFLTPDLKPFYGGTYFPKDRFRDLLVSIQDAWANHRSEVLASADQVRAAIADALRVAPEAGESVSISTVKQAAVARLKATFDRANGGFGGAPKFPPHGPLMLLLEAYRERADGDALDLAVRTLDAMARGGVYDQIGGGFHRYATDAAWRLPHFEKMLYDNALLVPVYLEAWKETGRPDLRRVAEETLAWVLREMTDARGGFYASLDADSDGEEGRYYLWTADEIRKAVPSPGGDLAVAYYGLGDLPSGVGGRGLPRVPIPLDRFAKEHRLTPEAARSRLEAARGSLLRARALRPPPRHDDKIVTAWNGLMISAFARAWGVTHDERYRAAAERAARFLLENARGPDGGLRASWTAGSPGPDGNLDDSAFLARGLLDLSDTTGDRIWLEEAARIAREADRFLDRDSGGYFFAPDGRKDLIVRAKSLEDDALPSGNAIMVEVLARLSSALADRSILAPAERVLDLAGPGLERSPLASTYLILAASRLGRPAPAGAGGAPIYASASPSLIVTPVLAASTVPTRQAHPGGPALSGQPAAGERVIQGNIVGRPNPERVVESSMTVPAGAVRPGQAVTLSLRLSIKPGWHVNSARPTLKYLISTAIEFPDRAAATVEEVAYPEGQLVTLAFAEEKLSVYQGETTIRATISPPRDGAPGPREIRARLTYQSCSDRTCLAPEKVDFQIPLVVQGEPVPAGPRSAAAEKGAAPSPPPAGGIAALLGAGGRNGEGVQALLDQRGLAVLLGVVFLAGLALNLTPCVYPMMPVTIGFFLNQVSGSWGRRVALPSLYVLGMAVTYSILGVLAGLTGSLFGSLLQKPWVTGLLVLVFVVMALSMFGLFEIRMPGWLTRFSGGRQGSVGAFLMGLTMGVAAAPCIGPFIVPLLAFVGASGKPLLGFWLFFVLAIGMGLPNLVLGISSGALAGLPRSGVWLIYAKKVMGVALLAVALYFLQPFLPDRRLGWIVLAFAIVSGAYLGLLDRTRVAAAWFRPMKILVGLLVIVGGTWIAVPMVGARPAPAWRAYSAEALAQAREDGQPVIIDFFADWCLPCKELDRFTFADRGVLAESDRFLLMKADLTSFESEPVRLLRQRFDVIGVPTIVFLDGRGEEHRDLRVYGFEDPGKFLEKMRQVR